jgi:hypothetical protein
VEETAASVVKVEEYRTQKKWPAVLGTDKNDWG